MHLRTLVATLICITTIILPLQALSAYRYTYTSGPLTYLESIVNIGNPPTIQADDVFKIDITSNALLTPSTFLLADTKFSISIGDYVIEPVFSEVEPPVLNFTFLEMSEFDDNHLPTHWSFDVSQVFAFAPNDNSALFFLSSPMGNIFSITAVRPLLDYSIIATASPGAWTLSEVSSPVPENETYALFFAGLGIVGYRIRNKRKDASYLKKSRRSKFNYQIQRKKA
jgi:hypothetical protein